MRYFTNSEMSTFRDCRRRWWLGTYRRLRPRARKVVGPAPIGTRVHQALAQWYVPEDELRVDPRTALEEIIAQDQADLIASLGEDEVANGLLVKDFEGENDLVRAMIEGYVEWLEETGVDSDYRVIASERAVAYQFADGLSIAGRIDTLLEKISDGSHLGMDHKTGDFGGLVKMLPMDEQMLLYEILRRVNTEGRSSGMLFNMLRKVKRTARAKPPFYQRLPVPFNQHQIDGAWHRTMAIINDILTVTTRLDSGESHFMVAYPRPNKDCSWKCEFFPVCPMFDDGSRAEDMIQSLYVVGDPLDRYPDLTEGTADE